MPTIHEPVQINNTTIKNRLYRAPLLECAGNGDESIDIFIKELEPGAEAGVGMIVQGACIPTEKTGCGAPNMTRVHDPDYVTKLSKLTDVIHEHDCKIFLQLGHGGIRSLETWHRKYRKEIGDIPQLAVSEPPYPIKLAKTLNLLDMDLHVMSTQDVYDLVEQFGKSAEYAADAGYDGIHIAASNMGIFHQFLSPYYNRREDEFGGGVRERTRIFKELHDEITDRVGSTFPIITKVPTETEAPWFVTDSLTIDDSVAIAEELDSIGYDALVPVKTSPFWDMTIIRGNYPDIAWSKEKYHDGYTEAFGSALRWKVVSWLNWMQSLGTSFESVWNREYFRQVKEAVDVPVLAVGGIRSRSHIDEILGNGECDMVGMARPFYAEPKLPARLLNNGSGAEVVCENCNNCTVPQVAGIPGTCRTPAVMEKKATLQKKGAYEV